jgi:hypothetical protein
MRASLIFLGLISSVFAFRIDFHVYVANGFLRQDVKKEDMQSLKSIQETDRDIPGDKTGDIPSEQTEDMIETGLLYEMTLYYGTGSF